MRKILARPALEARTYHFQYNADNNQNELSMSRQLQAQFEEDKLSHTEKIYKTNHITKINNTTNIPTSRRTSSTRKGSKAISGRMLSLLPDDEFEKAFLCQKDENEDEDFETFEREFLNRPPIHIQPRKKPKPAIISPTFAKPSIPRLRINDTERQAELRVEKQQPAEQETASHSLNRQTEGRQPIQNPEKRAITQETDKKPPEKPPSTQSADNQYQGQEADQKFKEKVPSNSSLKKSSSLKISKELEFESRASAEEPRLADFRFSPRTARPVYNVAAKRVISPDKQQQLPPPRQQKLKLPPPRERQQQLLQKLRKQPLQDLKEPNPPGKSFAERSKLLKKRIQEREARMKLKREQEGMKQQQQPALRRAGTLKPRMPLKKDGTSQKVGSTTEKKKKNQGLLDDEGSSDGAFGGSVQGGLLEEIEIGSSESDQIWPEKDRSTLIHSQKVENKLDMIHSQSCDEIEEVPVLFAKAKEDENNESIQDILNNSEDQITTEKVDNEKLDDLSTEEALVEEDEAAKISQKASEQEQEQEATSENVGDIPSIGKKLLDSPDDEVEARQRSTVDSGEENISKLDESSHDNFYSKDKENEEMNESSREEIRSDSAGAVGSNDKKEGSEYSSDDEEVFEENKEKAVDKEEFEENKKESIETDENKEEVDENKEECIETDENKEVIDEINEENEEKDESKDIITSDKNAEEKEEVIDENNENKEKDEEKEEVIDESNENKEETEIKDESKDEVIDESNESKEATEESNEKIHDENNETSEDNEENVTNENVNKLEEFISETKDISEDGEENGDNERKEDNAKEDKSSEHISNSERSFDIEHETSKEEPSNNKSNINNENVIKSNDEESNESEQECPQASVSRNSSVLNSPSLPSQSERSSRSSALLRRIKLIEEQARQQARASLDEAREAKQQVEETNIRVAEAQKRTLEAREEAKSAREEANAAREQLQRAKEMMKFIKLSLSKGEVPKDVIFESMNNEEGKIQIEEDDNVQSNSISLPESFPNDQDEMNFTKEQSDKRSVRNQKLHPKVELNAHSGVLFDEYESEETARLLDEKSSSEIGNKEEQELCALSDELFETSSSRLVEIKDNEEVQLIKAKCEEIAQNINLLLFESEPNKQYEYGDEEEDETDSDSDSSD